MKFRNRLMIPVALMALALASAARAQVLDQVPSNAIAVLKIKSLSGFNAKLIKLANAWGLDQMAPEFKDPLGSILEKGHMSQGINKDGDVALAFFPAADHAAGAGDAPGAPPASSPPDAAGPDAGPPGMGHGAPPQVLGLIPVSDYAAFVGNFKEPHEDGAITSATNPDDGKPVFIAHWGDFAAIADAKALLDNKPAGFKLAGLALKESEKDVTIFANMDQVRAFGFKLKDQRQKILDQISKNMGNDDASKKMLPVVKALVNMYMNAVQDYIEQGTSGVASLDLSDAGINTATFAEFQPDSRLGKDFTMLRGNSASGLVGLPDRKYFAVAGYAADAKVAQQMLSTLADPVIAELLQAGDQWKSVGDIVSATKDVLGQINSTSGGYLVPGGAPGQDAILQTVSVSSGDAKAIKDGYRKALTSLTDLLKAGPQSVNAPMTIDFKPDDKTVDGVTFDHFQSALSMDQNDPKAAQAQQAIALLYGPNGIGGYSGAADDSHYIMVSGGNDQLISDLIASAKAGQDAISSRPPVAMVASHLSKNPVVVYYIFLDQIAMSATKLAANFGFPIKLALPDNLPPIGVSAAAEGPSIRFDAFVPTELVQNPISAALKARQDMQAGNNGPQ